MKRLNPKRLKADEQGSIFVLVLWSLFILTIFALGLGRGNYQNINLAAYFRDTARIRFLAEAGAKAAFEVIKREANEFDALNEYWSTGRNSDESETLFEDIELGDGTYSFILPTYKESLEEEEEELLGKFGLIDEERKININTAPANVMENLIRAVTELDADKASIIANSIVDWRDADSSPRVSGAEDKFYQFQKEPYDCKDSEFEILEELLLVRGMTSEIFAQIRDFITIYGEGKVNINTAYRETLVSLGIDEYFVDSILKYRNGNDQVSSTKDDQNFEDSEDILEQLKSFRRLNEGEEERLSTLIEESLSVVSENFSVIIEAKFGRRTNRFSGVINKEEGLKYWREL